LWRRAVATVLAGFGAISLVANQITVQALLRERVRAEVQQPLPADKQVADYVHNQLGFWLCLGTLVLVVMFNGIGWFRSAYRASA